MYRIYGPISIIFKDTFPFELSHAAVIKVLKYVLLGYKKVCCFYPQFEQCTRLSSSLEYVQQTAHKQWGRETAFVVSCQGVSSALFGGQETLMQCIEIRPDGGH